MNIFFSWLDNGTLLVIIFVLLVVWLYKSTCVPRSFPPGPRPLPIIGNLLWLAGGTPLHALKTLTAMKDRYGPIMGLKLGCQLTVVLSNLESIKEAVIDKAEAFTDRPNFMHAWVHVWKKGGQPRGVASTNGHVWRDARRFSLHTMRDFGMGKPTLEERVYDEATAFCDVLATSAGMPYDPSILAQQATSNIACSLCFGTRFEYSDPDFIRMVKALSHFFDAPLVMSLYNFFPVLTYLPCRSWIDESAASLEDVYSFIEKQVDVHRSTLDLENPRDFIDLYLIKEREEGEDPEVISKDDLLATVRDIFQGGTDTSSAAIRWMILYMIRYPDIQKRCQTELDRVVGSGRHPTLKDRARLPYVDATIQELLRLNNIAPLAAPHATSRDTELAGYHIPKDTLVLLNLYAVHTDPRYWEDPLVFNPDRWLTQDGKLRKRESFLPFGAGPRLCLGENLAKTNFFVFFTYLLQRFTLSMSDPLNPPSLEGQMGFTLSPLSFDIIAKPR